jgi:poly(A) polymerase
MVPDPAQTFTVALRPWMTAVPTASVMAALAPEGTPRFVGGAVRDALMGEDPAGELDIATRASPERVMELLKSAGIRAIPTGIDHGTVTAVIGPAHFEITTLRRDVVTYGRRAEVAYTDDWRVDAARRDFTINAMSLTAAGEGFDYFGGRDDLANGRVRFVGDPAQRIDEDVLRILRFFRFFARYGRGEPDGAAMEAIFAASAKVRTLSGERVWMELKRILATPLPAPVCKLMERAGVLAQVLPEAGPLSRIEALSRVEALAGEAADPLRRLAAVVVTDAPGAVAARLRLSRAERQRLAVLVAPVPVVSADCTQAAARRMIYEIGRAAFRDRLMLGWADGGADGAFGALLALADRFEPPTFPLGGADAAAVGLAPGPAMGAALKSVEAWWVAEDFRPDREALMARLGAAAKA